MIAPQNEGARKMMRKLGIICRNNLYLKQLTEYLPEVLGREWTVSGYVDEEEYAERGTAEELLLAQIPIERRELVRKQLAADGRRILWLSEQRDEEAVFMYQSVAAIADLLLSAGEVPEQIREETATFRVIGYLSAEGGSGCTTAAFRKAVELGRGGSTFFLSLDNAPGLAELAKQTSGVSELVYLLKEYGADWGKQLMHCSCKLGEVTIVAGMERLGDVCELRAAEAEALMEGLRSLEFGSAVIDFGTSCAEALLQYCDIIYYCGAGEAKRHCIERQAENGGFRERMSFLGVSEVNGFERMHG